VTFSSQSSVNKHEDSCSITTEFLTPSERLAILCRKMDADGVTDAKLSKEVYLLKKRIFGRGNWSGESNL
jgi:hypothetical protein